MHLHDVLTAAACTRPASTSTPRTRHAEHLPRAASAATRSCSRDLARAPPALDALAPRKLLYPLVYGERRLLNRVRFVKPLLDRAGIWTLEAVGRCR